MKNYLYPSDILFPDFNLVDGTKWAVIACDQYTSEPEYWNSVEIIVGSEPSTLKLMLPEAHLYDHFSIPTIQETMLSYLEQGVLVNHPRCGIYLERTLPNGMIRKGLIACIDLEDYDYSSNSSSVIRATEKTVPERIPPRLAIRRDAVLEIPHVMLLINDPDNIVLGRFKGRKKDAYKFALMKQSGMVEASFVKEGEFYEINKALNLTVSSSPSHFALAVGDGNHSLATAKSAYEEIKRQIGERAASIHPARYALVEIVNIYDESLKFEPIYRLVKADEPEKLIADFSEYLGKQNGHFGKQTFDIVTSNKKTVISSLNSSYALPVTSLQKFLDDWANENPCEIDYIHGEKSICDLATQNGYVGFLFEGLEKNELFYSVEADGSLPRKTFSMGHADDKRFYIECRKIKL